MKEIKFRAWNGNHMYYDDLTVVGPDMGFNALIAKTGKTFNLMQYTGLKDKSGKEIYEGDVVLFVEDVIVETIEGHNRTEPEGNIGSVNFKKGAYYIQTPGNTNDFYSWGEQRFSWEELEIIGNIYENPELIEK